MYLCYILTGVSFLLISLTGAQGYFQFAIISVNHQTFALITAMIYLFTETLIIFFFVGTGVSIKEFCQMHQIEADFHQRSIEIKRKIYPPTLLNLLLIMVLFVIGGGVHTEVIPAWIHGTLFWISILHFAKTIRTQHQCFKANTEIFFEIAELKIPSEAEI